MGLPTSLNPTEPHGSMSILKQVQPQLQSSSGITKLLMVLSLSTKKKEDGAYPDSLNHCTSTPHGIMCTLNGLDEGADPHRREYCEQRGIHPMSSDHPEKGTKQPRVTPVCQIQDSQVQLLVNRTKITDRQELIDRQHPALAPPSYAGSPAFPNTSQTS